MSERIQGDENRDGGSCPPRRADGSSGSIDCLLSHLDVARARESFWGHDATSVFVDQVVRRCLPLVSESRNVESFTTSAPRIGSVAFAVGAERTERGARAVGVLVESPRKRAVAK